MKLSFLSILIIPILFILSDVSSLILATMTKYGLHILAIIVSVTSLCFLKMAWFDPWRIRKKLESQGIRGPKPRFLYGNVGEMHRIQANSDSNKSDEDGEFVAHDYTSTLFPYFEQWRKEYGPIYTYSTVNKQHLYVTHPEVVKEMNNHSLSSHLGKPSYITKRLAPMLGNGILRSNGHLWARQRKIVAPQFFMHRVKGMVGLMVESVESLISKWEGYIESQGGNMAEIEVEEDLRSVSADVISKACFGSSFLKGKRVFTKLRTLQKLMSNQNFLFGSHSLGIFLTGQQKKIEQLEKEIESLIWDAVKERDGECFGGNKDLMQMILEGAMNNVSDDNVGKVSNYKKFIVDNCKNIYFAGHESTAVAASWCLMLLALHPQWQSRIREEVDDVCHANGEGLCADSLHKLKTTAMVIHEVLRLYPPAAFVSREALQETKIGHIVVPKGVCLWTLIPTLHRDPDIWGADANEFNPQRFANGISNVYIPFGLGPRLCLGKSFALVQLKIIVFLIVSKFTFTLSPKYRHSPAFRMIVEPGHDVRLCIRRR
ncbi:cytochrome P450 714A1-like [Henckelia pumila]|uniref:cytochrome P450 714A1-like n=1 Tax=Henckelia pumila TaxID=405737 RepID=UPI003C6E44AC